MGRRCIVRARVLGICMFGLIAALGDISAQGQKISTTDLLKKTIGTQEELLQRSFAENIRQYDYSIPFLEKIDLRTETGRLTTARQEFLLRTSFNGFGESNAAKNKQSALHDWKAFKEVKVRNESILKRYRDLNNCLYLQKEGSLISKKQEIINEKLKISEDIIQTGNSFDLGDYVELKVMLLESKDKIAALSDEKKALLLSFETSPNVEIAEDDWIEILDIKQKMDNLTWNAANHYTLTELELESQFLATSRQVEQAKSNKFIDFAQAKYTVREDLTLESRFSVGLGFTIPWLGSTKNKLNDIKIKETGLTVDKNIQIYKLEEKYRQTKILFDQKILQLQNFLAIINDKDLQALKEKIILSGRLSSLKILKIKEDELDLLSKKLKLENEIIELYITLLDTSGKLYESPYRNFLSKLGNTF